MKGITIYRSHDLMNLPSSVQPNAIGHPAANGAPINVALIRKEPIAMKKINQESEDRIL